MLLERHDLCGAMLDAVNHYLEDRGMRIGTGGLIVDATIIHAPSSTETQPAPATRRAIFAQRQPVVFRDEGTHWGGSAEEGIVHSVCSTAASVADKHMLAEPLHGHEHKVRGDGAYQGQGEAIRKAAPQSPRT